MADSKTTLSAVISAKDEASQTLNQISKTMLDLDAKSRAAGSGFEFASEKFSGASEILTKLPSSLSKGASALSALGGAASSAGGQIGESIVKVSQLGSLVAGGGALGIGIAAVTVAVAAGKVAWEAYGSESRAINGFLPSLSGAFKTLSDDLAKSRQDVESLTNEIVWFGKNQKEQTIGTLKETTEAQERNIESNQKMVDSMRQQADAKAKLFSMAEKYGMAMDESERQAKAEAESLRMQADALEKGNDIARDSVISNYNRITLLEELVNREGAAKKATDDKRKADEAESAAAKARADAEREVAEALADTDKKSRTYSARAMKEAADWSEQNARHEQEYEDRAKLDNKVSSDGVKNANRVAHAYSGVLAGAIVDVATKQKTMGEAGKAALVSIGRSAVSAAVDYAIGEGIKQIASKITATTSVTADAAAAVADVAATNVQISAASARGAAESISAFAGVPVVGPALGAAQAGVVVGMIEGTRGLMAMADGGIIHGGIPGIDSVPLMGQQGERVLTVEQTKSFDRFVSALERGSFGGLSGSTTINLSSRTLFSPSSAESKRQVRDVMRVAKRVR